MKHIKTLNTKKLQKKVDVASVRHPVSLHVRHPVP